MVYILLSVLVQAHGAAAEPPQCWERWGEQQRYKMLVCAKAWPILLNHYQTWSFKVYNHRGHIVHSMAVQVDGMMPEHKHGLPTKPLIEPATDGTYQLEGLKFNMPGLWLLRFVLMAEDGINDTITLDLNIDF